MATYTTTLNTKAICWFYVSPLLSLYIQHFRLLKAICVYQRWEGSVPEAKCLLAGFKGHNLGHTPHQPYTMLFLNAFAWLECVVELWYCFLLAWMEDGDYMCVFEWKPPTGWHGAYCTKVLPLALLTTGLEGCPWGDPAPGLQKGFHIPLNTPVRYYHTILIITIPFYYNDIWVRNFPAHTHSHFAAIAPKEATNLLR